MKPNARLALIGNGQSWYENKVKREVTKRHLENNIDLLGFIDGVEKYKILKSSKVFLHTSVYDNCGMAAAEAMACGLPVVRFDIPHLKVAFPDGCLIAPLKDCKSFAKCVLDLLENKEQYSQLKREALKAAEYWNWDEKAQKTLDWLNTALFE